MTCVVCNGDKWLFDRVPHPLKPDTTMSTSRPCPYCGGTGRVKPPAADAKSVAANDKD